MQADNIVVLSGENVNQRIEQRNGVVFPLFTHWLSNIPVAHQGPNTNTQGYTNPDQSYKWPLQSIASPFPTTGRKIFNDEILHPIVQAGKPNRPLIKHGVTYRQPINNQVYPGPYQTDQNYGPNGTTVTSPPGIYQDAKTQSFDPITFAPKEHNDELVTGEASVPVSRSLFTVGNVDTVPAFSTTVNGPQAPMKGMDGGGGTAPDGSKLSGNGWQPSRNYKRYQLRRCPQDYSHTLEPPTRRGGNNETSWVEADYRTGFIKRGIDATEGETGAQMGPGIQNANDAIPEQMYNDQQEGTWFQPQQLKANWDRLAKDCCKTSIGILPYIDQGGSLGDACSFAESQT